MAEYGPNGRAEAMTSLPALSTEFETIRPSLRSFVLRMTASAADTDDLVQDTYIKAHEKIESFHGDSSLKTWLRVPRNMKCMWMKKNSGCVNSSIIQKEIA